MPIEAPFLVRFLPVLGRVAARRLRRGPAHPEWGLLLEATVEALRAAGDAQLAGTLAAWRAGQEKQAASTPLARGVVESRRDLAACPTLVLAPANAEATLLYFHGGGYTTGSPRTHRGLASRLAAASRFATLVPDYRLAPEHPFPAAIDDAVACIEALYAEGVDPKRLAIGGDSAGGGLTLTTLVTLKQRGLPLPALGVLLCPWVDLEGTLPSIVDNARYDWGDRRTLDFYALTYAKGQLRDPRVSPIHYTADDLRGLPPLVVQWGDAEVLRDECRQLVEQLTAAGLSLDAREWPGMVHDWQLFAPFVPQSNAAIAELAAALRRRVLR